MARNRVFSGLEQNFTASPPKETRFILASPFIYKSALNPKL
jgi:hypothetical protein